MALKPIEALTAKAASILTKNTRPGIVLYRPYPPTGERPGRSKIGGLPFLPESIAWPVGTAGHGAEQRREPMAFLAQVDCADLPEGPWPLPSSGMLFFFAVIDAIHQGGDTSALSRVIYVPDLPASAGPRQPPDNMPLIPWRDVVTKDAHLVDDPLGGKLYGEWPLLPARVDSYRDPDLLVKDPAWQDLEKSFEDTLSALCETMEKPDYFRAISGFSDGPHEYIEEKLRIDFMAEQIVTALGVDDPRSLGRPPHSADPSKDFFGGDHTAAFPFVANIISEIAASVIVQCEHAQRREVEKADRDHDRAVKKAAEQKKGLFGFGKAKVEREPLPEWFERFDALIAEAGDWLDRARTMARAAVPDDTVRATFRDWITDLQSEPFQILSMRSAFDRGLVRTLTHSASEPSLRAAIPDTVYDAYRHWIGWHIHTAHLMMGYFPSCQQSRPEDDPMIPLMHITADNAVGTSFGDMGEMHFFIAPDALERRDFDAAFTINNSS